MFYSYWHLRRLISFNVSPATRGSRLTFNISWLSGGHPILDPVVLTSDANRTLYILLDMLQSASSLPGSITITIVNWWVSSPVVSCFYSELMVFYVLWSFFFFLNLWFFFFSPLSCVIILDTYRFLVFYKIWTSRV